MSGFGRALDRLHQVGLTRLADGCGSYQEDGRAPVRNLELIVDRNLAQETAEGVIQTQMVGITYRVDQLPHATRGGVFHLGAQRYLVQDFVSDDGRLATVATAAL